MTSNNRRILFLIGVALLVALYGFLTWYKNEYSMKPAHAFEIGAANAAKRILIATQGSAFKDRLIADLADHFSAKPIYVRVIDVTALPTIHENDWSAIVIVHTWENWRPQPDAANFATHAKQPNKIIAIATSGSGKERLAVQGIDAISAASTMSNEPALLGQITARLDAMLADR